ncbi:MAG: glycosyltransferase [Alphaproteobacteria bacterium]|nr:glycosyltransferase [Alphaproteobacteria bacterium]
MSSPSVPVLSVVIPLMNEAGNISPLIAEIASTLRAYPPVGEDFEILCVDDGSTDATAAEVRQMRSTTPQVRLIRHPRRLGMSAALRNGIRRARTIWILTIDGDRQNDPADIPLLCDLAWNKGKERDILVAGIRVNRRDTMAKRLASRFANVIRKFFLNDDCPDTGCSLKIFQRDAYLELPFFKGLHRFMPALFRLYGHEVIFTPVNDRPRRVGQTKSDFLGRAVRGFFDLLGVIWLVTRTPAPERGREDIG